MRIYSQSYFKEIIEEHYIASLGVFKAYVVEGIENFNLQKVFKAVISAEFTGVTGYYYDNFEEAKNESLALLNKCYDDLKKDIDDLNKFVEK